MKIGIDIDGVLTDIEKWQLYQIVYQYLMLIFIVMLKILKESILIFLKRVQMLEKEQHIKNFYLQKMKMTYLKL